MSVKNIIFDLGGVLLNIDFNRTYDAFKDLGVSDLKSQFNLYAADKLFEALEIGAVSEDDFCTALLKKCKPGTSFEQIRNAWNAILVDFRLESLDFLSSLSDKYNLYLLSNTNSIHLTAFHQIFTKQTGKENFDAYFKEAYYSHLIKKRKPFPATYQHVIDLAGIKSAETLFIDDSKLNIDGAKEAGLNTYLLGKDERIEGIGL